MFTKVFIILLATLAFIYLATIIFEYCLNEASNTELTVSGVLLLIAALWLYITLLYRTLKKRPAHYD